MVIVPVDYQKVCIMKKWFSRGIVLAMVLVMMVPMPVAAKGGKGSGKLVKSVTAYYPNSAGTGWVANSKTTYTYDKKNNPKEIKKVTYDEHLFGVPVSGELHVTTMKFKYKGKKAKSSKVKNEIGVVTARSSYKNGKPVSTTYTKAYSSNDGTPAAEAYQHTDTVVMAFAKNGLPASRTVSSSTQKTGVNPYTSSTVETTTYAWTQKKGIPSLVYTTKTEAHNGGPASNPKMYYTVFDGKGLALESGDMEKNTVPKPQYRFTYTKKKGKVTQVVVTNAATGKAVKMFTFKYNRTRISKTRYMSMINSIVGYSKGNLCWY